MSESQHSGGSAGAFRISWVSAFLLVLIVAFGGLLRWDHIAKENLWLDEYWALYLATGRGNQIFEVPTNQIIEHAPDVGFHDAPAWWHIWNGISTASHPPLYHMALRFWVDLFGDSDRAIRAMSACFSLGGIVLLYFAVRRLSGDEGQALIAAALMALAPVQIYYSQEARPYTMLQFIALVAAILLITIEKRGSSWVKLSALGLAVLALAMTHYFGMGVIGAFAVYAMIRFRGRVRWGVLAAVVVSCLIFAAVWGSHVGDYSVTGYGRLGNRNLLHMFLSAPQRLTMESNQDPLVTADNGPWLFVIAIGSLVYLFPLLLLRWRPYLLLWWLWAMGGVGLVLAIDVARHSTLMSVTRYVTQAAPAVYALLAAPLPGRMGKIVPWAIFVGVLIFGIDYWQAGPPNSPDVKTVSNMVRSEVLPGDIVIVSGDYYFAGEKGPPLTYFAISHYAGPWRGPVMFGTSLIDEEVQAQLQRYRRVWVIGILPESDTRKILPDWQIHDVHGSGDSNLLWYVTPGKPGEL